MAYNRNVTADIMSRLTSYQSNPQELIDNLRPELQDKYMKNFVNKLNNYDYQSDTIMTESLEEVANELTRGLRHDKKDEIQDMILQGWSVEELQAEYGTTQNWKDYIDLIKTANDIMFYY